MPLHRCNQLLNKVHAVWEWQQASTRSNGTTSALLQAPYCHGPDIAMDIALVDPKIKITSHRIGPEPLWATPKCAPYSPQCTILRSAHVSPMRLTLQCT